MAFLSPSRSNRPQVLALSRWWLVTLNHQQSGLCFHFQGHASSFLSLTRLGHSLCLVREMKWGGGGRRKEEGNKKPTPFTSRRVFQCSQQAGSGIPVTAASSVITSELWVPWGSNEVGEK